MDMVLRGLWGRVKLDLCSLRFSSIYGPGRRTSLVVDDIVAGEPVRAGTQVWISPWVIHRHRKFWDNPTAFQPDRFADRPSPWTGAATFIPFGLGPRICIGATFAFAEAQIMMATMLSRFAIALHDSRPVLPVATVTTAPSYEPSFALERI